MLPMLQQVEDDSAIHPVCGMTVNRQQAAGSHKHHGETYYFCNAKCLEKFKANPDRYINKAESAATVDPVCGMTVDPAGAAATAEYNGQTYYFCNPSCHKKFVSDPDRYVSQAKSERHWHPAEHGRTWNTPVPWILRYVNSARAAARSAAWH